MPKRILFLLIPGPLRTLIKKKEAEKILSDFVPDLHVFIEKSSVLIESNNFTGSRGMLARAYRLKHDLKMIKGKAFYDFIKTDVYAFLVLLKHQLEDAAGKDGNSSSLTESDVRLINTMIEKINFIMLSEDTVLPKAEILFMKST